jgi:hypothetical protein
VTLWPKTGCITCSGDGSLAIFMRNLTKDNSTHYYYYWYLWSPISQAAVLFPAIDADGTEIRSVRSIRNLASWVGFVLFKKNKANVP